MEARASLAREELLDRVSRILGAMLGDALPARQNAGSRVVHEPKDANGDAWRRRCHRRGAVGGGQQIARPAVQHQMTARSAGPQDVHAARPPSRTSSASRRLRAGIARSTFLEAGTRSHRPLTLLETMALATGR